MPEKLMQVFSKYRSVVVVGILLLALAGGFFLSKRLQPETVVPGDKNSIPVALDSDTSQSVGNDSNNQTDKYGLQIKLGDGQSQPQTIDASPLATGEPLSPDEIALILSRLPTLAPVPGEQTAFNLPQDVLPPPRPGNTIKETFPPLETAPTPGAVDAGPLQVLRFAPEGEIPIAPFVSVTFNQPMVPLGTLSDLADKDVPLQIEPPLPGTWRWLGTKTLTFEYDSKLIDRLPKATEFHLTVPAGTKSANGGILAESVSWSFKTPPPKVVTTYPDNSPQPLDPIFFIAFDQRVNPAAVLKSIVVLAGGKDVGIVLAAQTEIDKNERVSQLVKDAPEGRWLAFRAVQALPRETNISVMIKLGTPSAEGPLTTTEVQSFDFPTYAPLRIEEHRCSWYDDRCPPLTPFSIRFNNPLDMNVFSAEMLRVEPAIPGVSAN
ncbi:MAG: Ig-like domain-containing protein, partial [Chloroflexota bacterium]